jgi:hypothetical protein
MKTFHMKLYKEDEFPYGTWSKEPDFVAWYDERSGYPCVMNRTSMGAWCGYVGVPETHPWYGFEYSDVFRFVFAHGGLTYSDEATPDIRHPGHTEPVWFFGFDCAHSGDLVPASLAHTPFNAASLFNGDVYRDLSYVRLSVTHLARHLRGAAQYRELFSISVGPP